MMPTALFFLYVPAYDDGVEFKYSLRALPDTGEAEVLVVGDRPSWLRESVPFLSTPEADKGTDKTLRVIGRVLEASRVLRARGHTEAVFMYDDLLWLGDDGSDPWGMYRTELTLSQMIESHSSEWTQWMRPARQYLRERCRDIDPLPSYELHRPLPVELAAVEEVLVPLLRWYLEWGKGGVWRTVYGTLRHGDAAPTAKDGKISSHVHEMRGWLSTSERFWLRHGRAIDEMFPQPSRWELS